MRGKLGKLYWISLGVWFAVFMVGNVIYYRLLHSDSDLGYLYMCLITSAVSVLILVGVSRMGSWQRAMLRDADSHGRHHE
jgi:hypothetical protein